MCVGCARDVCWVCARCKQERPDGFYVCVPRTFCRSVLQVAGGCCRRVLQEGVAGCRRVLQEGVAGCRRVLQEGVVGGCCRLQEGVVGGCCRRVLQDPTLVVAGSHIAHEHIARNSQKNVSTVSSTLLFYRVAKTHRMP